MKVEEKQETPESNEKSQDIIAETNLTDKTKKATAKAKPKTETKPEKPMPKQMMPKKQSKGIPVKKTVKGK